jgi:ABC-type lipoprotein release transport system permease subunit
MDTKKQLACTTFFWRLSWRFFINSSKAGLWRWISSASIISIGVTAAFLLIAYGIINGLHEATHTSLHALQPDVEITGTSEQHISQLLPPSWRCSTAHTLPISCKKGEKNSNGLLLGIASSADKRYQHFAPDKEPLAYNEVLVGSSLAHMIGVQPGDTITLYWQIDEEENDKQTVRVKGIYHTGFDEWDAYGIICDLELSTELESTHKTTSVCCFTSHQDELFSMRQLLVERLPYCTIQTWHEKYPAILSALNLEKIGLSLLLGCLMLLAFLHTAAIIVLTVQQKLKSLGLLYMYGCSRAKLYMIMSFIGIQATLLGALPGLLLATIIGKIVTATKAIALPDVYYVDYLPVLISYRALMSFIALYACIGLIAGLILTRKLKKNELQKSLVL